MSELAEGPDARMEPGINGEPMLSIAISLRRIADILAEHTNLPHHQSESAPEPTPAMLKAGVAVVTEDLGPNTVPGRYERFVLDVWKAMQGARHG